MPVTLSYYTVVIVGYGLDIKTYAYHGGFAGKNEAMGESVDQFLKSFPHHSIRSVAAHDITANVRNFVAANPEPPPSTEDPR